MIKLIIFYLHVAIAYHCQEKYNIPVSIQIAQSMAESGLGYSNVARQSNNCFGIVAFSNWKGKVYQANKHLAFRKYDTIEEGYTDHAEFLHHHYRNAVGKNWKYWVTYCKGYGASSNYWNKIGKIIEIYKLYKFDVIN